MMPDRLAAKLFACVFFLLASLGVSSAQTPNGLKTNKVSVSITAGNTFQLLQAAASRNSLTIQNNNANTDNCLLLIGGPWQVGDTTSTSRTVNGASLTAPKDAIILQPGQPYTRYYPYTPNDQLLVTCPTGGDSVYGDYQ